MTWRACKIMPITPFLGDQKFDPETTRIMGVALEKARAVVKRDWGDLYASHSLAKRIIELAQGGERNPDQAGFTNAILECGQKVCTAGKRRAVEDPDHRHRGLLRPRHKRPRRRVA
jgi:hypothetical protein